MSIEKKHSGSTAGGKLAPHFGQSPRPSNTNFTAAGENSIVLAQPVNAGLSTFIQTENSTAVGSPDKVVIAVQNPDMTISCVDTIADVPASPPDSRVPYERVDAQHEKQTGKLHLDLESMTDSTDCFRDAGAMLVPIADASFQPGKVVPSADKFVANRFSSPTGETGFEPKWKVDQFLWPAVTTDLIYQFHELFDTATDLLQQSVLTGRSRLAITGIVRGEGRTTIAIALARKLMNDGKRILLVDADLVNPCLSSAIGLRCDISWLSDDSIARVETGAVNELVIGNRLNKTCVLPLAVPNRMSFNQHAFEVLNNCLNQLEPFFDVVILDMGPVSQLDAATMRTIRLAQSGMLIHDPELSNVHNFTRAFEKFLTLEFDAFALLQNSARGSIDQVA